MKTLRVEEWRKNIHAVMKDIARGNAIAIASGQKRKTVAVIIPAEEYERTHPRKIGVLDGVASCAFQEDWHISDEELVRA